MLAEASVPRARGGSDRISNLTLACAPCNTRKGSQTAEEFGGWFAMNHDAGPDITVTFFDGAVVVNSLLVPLAVDCSWHWIGWSLS